MRVSNSEITLCEYEETDVRNEERGGTGLKLEVPELLVFAQVERSRNQSRRMCELVSM